MLQPAPSAATFTTSNHFRNFQSSFTCIHSGRWAPPEGEQ